MATSKDSGSRNVIASGAKQSPLFQIKSNLTHRYNNKDCFVVSLKDGALLAMTNETNFRGLLYK